VALAATGGRIHWRIHWPVPGEEIEEGWSTLVELKERGVVRHPACSPAR
jgi:aryl-alcohol dehydrogenase-like predicted oxidoreductase